MLLTPDGTSLFVEDLGGGGTPVVFQHGLGGDAFQTREAFPLDPALRMITVECRCHGRSDPGPIASYRLADFADDIAAQIERHFIAPVVVGGISMGAAIGMRLAVKRPELVKALILARPAWLCDAAPANLAVIRLVGQLLGDYQPDEALRRFEQTEEARHFAVAAPDNLNSLRGYFARKDLDCFAPLLRAIAADGPGVTEAEVAAIRVPTLVIGTEDDLVHPMAHARVLAGLIRGAQLCEITSKSRSRTAYVDMFRAAVADFCARLPAT